MTDCIFSEEVLAQHRCRIDKDKLRANPAVDWDEIYRRAHSVEVLRAQIHQLEERAALSQDPEATYRMKQNIKKLREVLLTVFPTVKPYAALET